MDKRKQPKKKLNLSSLRPIGSAMKDIAVGAASHPVTAALFVMAGTVILQFATGAFSDEMVKKHPNLMNTRGQLAGLYDGAQKIAAASALAPIAVSAAQAIGSIAQMKAAQAQVPAGET